MSIIVCRSKTLPEDKLIEAAAKAVEINPTNRPNFARLSAVMPGFAPTPRHIAMVTKKYWGVKGVKLTVGFLDNPKPDLRKKILRHMNAWGRNANVLFTASQTNPDVRISRVNSPPDDAGYWSYIGTEIRSIDPGDATMNLEGFTMSTPDSEFFRVVRHETGHTLGFEHEHLRKELVHKIDVEKAIAFFKKSDGWSEADTRAQVLTPLRDASLTTSGAADQHSIMCYEIPGEITIDGKPIIGGVNLDPTDRAFAAKIYPKAKSKAKPKAKKKKTAKPK
jgi:hypothetical protein